jgi:hypothetical protein
MIDLNISYTRLIFIEWSGIITARYDDYSIIVSLYMSSYVMIRQKFNYDGSLILMIVFVDGLAYGPTLSMDGDIMYILNGSEITKNEWISHNYALVKPNDVIKIKKYYEEMKSFI